MEGDKNHDSLFELIKALTAVEKAYFKKFAGGSEEVNYLRLFDFINALPEYDEIKIRKKFQGEKFLKNFSVAKNYLFESIMDSLRSYNKSKSASLKADNMLGNLRILHEKGLQEVFIRQLEKGKAFIEQNELTFHHLEILELEKTHNFNKSKSNREVQEKINLELQHILNRNRIAAVNEKILNWLYKNERVKTEPERRELDLIIQDPVCHLPAESFNFYGLNTYYSTWSFYFYALGDNQKSIDQKILQYENYNANPLLKRTNEKFMLLVLGNLLSMCYSAGNKILFARFYAVLLEEIELCKENEMLVRELYLSMTILKCKLWNEEEKALEFLAHHEKEIVEGLNSFGLIRVLDICFNAAGFYFWKKDFKKALQWNRYILSHPSLDNREFMHGYARIFELISHYELNNIELANSLLRSCYRYFTGRGKLNEFEKVLIATMRQLIRSSNANDRKEAFKKLKKELIRFNEDPFLRNSINHFDYLRWLDEKI